MVFLAVQRTTGTPAQGTTSTDQVVVAATAIPAGQKITAAELTTRAFPTNNVPVGYLSLASEAIGKIAAVTITAGLPITADLLTTTPGTTNVPIPNQLDIAPGDVALAIPASGTTPDTSTALMTVGFYIQAGDHIDILVDDGGPSADSNDVSYGFQDVPVLAVGGQTASTASPAATTTTTAPASPTYLIIELPRNQAEVMTALLTQRFTNSTPSSSSPSSTAGPTAPYILKYVLRPSSEYGTPASPKYEAASGPALTDPGDQPVTPQSSSTQFAP